MSVRSPVVSLEKVPQLVAEQLSEAEEILGSAAAEKLQKRQQKIDRWQYSDFEWATYSETVTPVHKSPIVIKHKNNPQVVAMANVVLWLDIGKQSKAMKAELNEASKRCLKVVRLGECSTDQNDFVIETGGGMPNYVRKTDAPEYLGDLLRQIVSDQMRSKDVDTDQKVEGKG